MTPLLVTPQQLVAIYGCTYIQAATASPFLNDSMRRYDIVTPTRVADYLAQIGHESTRLRYVREIWGPTPQQRRYERDPGAPWPRSSAEARLPKYATNRLAFALGNTEPGDGKRYLGRSWIQCTGRKNYGLASDALGEDFVAYPALLETLKHCAEFSAYYWRDLGGCNALSDQGDFDAITRRINGGQNGRADRLALRDAARRVLEVSA